MDKRVIAAMGLLAVLLALVLGYVTRPTTVPTPAPLPTPRVVAAPAPAPAPDRNTNASLRPIAPRDATQRPSREAAAAIPMEAADYQQTAKGGVPNEEKEEQRREYRCRTLQEQADLMDRLIVVGGGGTLQPEQRLSMVSRVATLGTRVYEEDENIRSGALDCGDSANTTDMSGATDFLARSREELDDLLSDQDMEEISQAIALFEGRLAPAE